MTIQKLRWLQILTDGMLGKSHVGGLGKETDPVRVELLCAARNIKMAMTVMFLRSPAFISAFSFLRGFDTLKEFGLSAPFPEVIPQPYPPPPRARLMSMKRKHSNMDSEMSISEEIEFDVFLLTIRRRLEIIQGIWYPPMPKKRSIIYMLPCGRVELENHY
ncbi:hypothetical protein IFM89_010376 [Coptis chinensis]|uniref:Uncharacterized protein n=1 Tax=Coptis chinensis TaxID=261450 RepID=A0A835ISL7_9MAGN|nr:hypothetical protein IFM89_010376 [Coptis chinensis]